MAASGNPVVPFFFFFAYLLFGLGLFGVFVCLLCCFIFFNKLPNCVSEEYFMGMLAVIFHFCFLSKHSMWVHMCEVNDFFLFFLGGLSRLCAPQKSDCHQIPLWTKE